MWIVVGRSLVNQLDWKDAKHTDGWMKGLNLDEDASHYETLLHADYPMTITPNAYPV